MSTEPATAPIAIEREGPIAVIELRRPERRNAWSAEVGDALEAALAEIGADGSVRAVVLRGSGGSFCAGADLAGDVLEDPDLGEVLMRHYAPVIRALRALPQPVVAAVEGPAVGAGWALALACDLVVAGESAYFILAFTKLGLAPDAGASAFVPLLAGRLRAAELALLADRLDATTALEWGLVNRVVRDDEVEDTARTLASRLAAGPPRAFALTKQLLERGQLAALDAALEHEAEVQRELGTTADFREGVAAFRERRSPEFGAPQD